MDTDPLYAIGALLAFGGIVGGRLFYVLEHGGVIQAATPRAHQLAAGRTIGGVGLSAAGVSVGPGRSPSKVAEAWTAVRRRVG
jgi:hypothetical protein